MLQQLHVKTHARQEFLDITSDVENLVKKSGVQAGICYLFCPHTTGGITFNENWDPDVRRDMTLAFNTVSPNRPDFRHAEGNSDAHVKSSMMSADHFVIIDHGQLMLGRWQGIYFTEFDGPRSRTLYVKIVGDTA